MSFAGTHFMLPCTLRQLEIFLAAAEDCHFARTANRLGISQPAVSSHIGSLEDRLGRQLFIRRRGSKPILSDHGLALLSEARSFFAQGDKIRGFQTTMEEQEPVTVRVCAGIHLLDDCIKPRLSEFYRRFSKLDIDCQYVSTPGSGVTLLQSGKTDLLVFTVADPADYPVHSEVLRSVRFGLYASRKFEDSRHASAVELSTLPFILPAEGSAPDRMVQEALLRTGILCTNVVARAQFSDVIMDLARQGHGIAALFETMLERDADRELIKLDIELPTLFRTLFRMKGPRSRAIQAVEGFLHETLST